MWHTALPLPRLFLVAILLASVCTFGAEPEIQPAAAVELVPQLGHGVDVRNLVFSRDGRFAASVDKAGTLKVWELERGFELRSVFGTSVRSEVLGFSPDDRTVYVAGEQGLISVDVVTGKFSTSGNLRPELVMTDGRTYIQSARRKGVVIGDFAARKEVRIEGIADDAVVNESAASARAGLAVLHLTRTRELLIVDVATHTIKRRIGIGADDVRRLALSDDGRYVAVIEDHAEQPIRLAAFEVETGRQTIAFSAPGTTRMYALVFLPGTSHFAVGGSLDFGGIRMFDANSGNEMTPLPWPRKAIDYLAADSAGGRIGIVADSLIEIRAARAIGGTAQQLGPTGDRASLISSSFGTYYAVLDRPGHKLTVHASNDHRMIFETPVAEFSPAAFLGDRAALFHRDGALWLRPLPSGAERRLLDVGRSSLNNLTGSGNARVLAYSHSFERTMHIVRLQDDFTVSGSSSHEVGGLTDRGLVLSPDANLLLLHALNDGALTLRDTATGKVVSHLAQRADPVFRTLRFAKDGRGILLREDSRIRVWRGPSWSMVYDRATSRDISDADFTPDGTRVRAIGRDGVFDVTLTSPYEETSLSTLRGRSLAILPDASPPSGVVIGENGGRAIFSTAASTSRTVALRGNASDVQGAVVAGDGAYVATRERNRFLGRAQARIWDAVRGTVACHLDGAGVLGTHPGGWIVEDGGEVRLLGLADCEVQARLYVGTSGSLIAASHLPQGEVLGVTWDGRVLLLDIRRGLRLAEHQVPSKPGRPTLVHQLNAVAYFDAQQKAVRVVEPRGLTELARLDLAEEQAWVVQGVPGTSLVVVATSGGRTARVRVWDVREKRVIHDTAIGNLAVSTATVDVDQGLLLVGFERGLLGWWRLGTEKPDHGVIAHYGRVTAISSLPGGRVFTSGMDGAVRLWRGKSARADVSLVNFSGEDWVAATAEGYFNASRGGADGIVFRRDLSVLPLNQFYDVFYRPDIVEAKLRGEDVQGLVRVTIADALANPPPEVEIEAERSGTDRTVFRYRVKSMGGGVGDIRVYHNGKLLMSDGVETSATRKEVASLASVTPESITRSLRGLIVAADAPAMVRAVVKPDEVEGRVEVENVPGDNEVAVAAFNRTNTVQSGLKSVAYSSARTADPPRLFVVTVGIDDYAERPLKFAVKDATDIARELRVAAGTLYPADRIEVIQLHDSKASRSGILGALEDVANRIKPWDALVLFVASHGLMHEGQYAMVTHDFRRKTPDQWFVSTGELMEISKKIRSLRQVFVFDTCHAGGLDGMVTGLYDARMTVMARNMGLHLLTAASKSQEAIDGHQGNGLFTHALLAALADPATDLNLDSNVSIMELGDSARRRAVEIARRIRYTQTPLAIHFGRDQTLYSLRK